MPWTIQTRPHAALSSFLLLLLTPPITAQQPPPWVESNQNNNSPMATALIVMIIVFFSVGFISVYLRHFLACLGIRPYVGQHQRGLGMGGWTTREHARGLDPSIVKTFPTFLYSDVKVHRVGKTTPLECAICLNEFYDHELLRLLPKCNHVFHPHCIGPWLASHVTCPVCRANLEIQVYNQRTFEQHLQQQQTSEDESEPSDQIVRCDDHDHHGDVIVRLETPPEITEKSPIQEIMKGLTESGRIRLQRSHSTGHSLVEDCERYTLRLPEEVRNKLVNDKNNLSGLPAAIISPRFGYRDRNVGCVGSLSTKPDRWRFSMSPPFVSLPSSPKLDGYTGCIAFSSSNNNKSLGLLKSPRNLFKSIISPNKSPLNHGDNCNDIGERSSDKLWSNKVAQELDLEGRH